MSSRSLRRAAHGFDPEPHDERDFRRRLHLGFERASVQLGRDHGGQQLKEDERRFSRAFKLPVALMSSATPRHVHAQVVEPARRPMSERVERVSTRSGEAIPVV
ncbi:MAG: hypothetical protein ACHQQS_13530 [Thermoanaerobaculales bacterium]